MLIFVYNQQLKEIIMTITSKDLGGGDALTGVARREHEDRVREAEKSQINQKILEDAIAHIEKEKEKALAAQDLKKKKEAKKKKSKVDI